MTAHASGATPRRLADSGATDTTRTGARRRLRDLVAVNFGNTLEWFDWTIYTIFAPYFAVQFFQHENPTSALLSTLAIFAVGFVTRPLGGIVFGAYADRAGRRRALTVAMMLTAFGSLVIALSPTFDAIGVAASVILLLARLLQGLAHGGEMGTAVTYLVERAPEHRRGLYGSSSWVSVVLGSMLATFTGLIITSVLSESQIASWGWRVAFGLGGLLGLYALYLRRQLTETDAFEKSASGIQPAAGGLESATEPSRSLLQHWRAVLVVVGLSVGGSVMFYTWVIYMPTSVQLHHGQGHASALGASLIAQAVFLLAIPACGWLGDRIGRRPLVIGFGVAFVALTYPVYRLPDGSFATLLIALLISLLGLALLFGVNGAIWAEVFPTQVRAVGVAAPLSFATAIFGGTAPYINTALTEAGRGHLFIVYLIAVAAVTLVTGLLMRETRGLELTRSS